MMRHGSIAQHRIVARRMMCRMLAAPRGGFQDWQGRGLRRQATEKRLLRQIRSSFENASAPKANIYPTVLLTFSCRCRIAIQV